MVQNVGRLIALIATLLAASLFLILVPSKPLRLGLDLAGGTRLMYVLDITGARAQGVISAQETDVEVLQQQIEIIRSRIDPQGITEPVVRKAGENRIEILLPKQVETRASASTAPLALPAEATARELSLQGDSTSLVGFSGGGGVVGIENELVRYASRVENVLAVETRGFQDTQAKDHPAGATVTLISDDAIKNAIENLGDLRFLPVAVAADFTTRGTDQQTADAALRTWLAVPENAGLPIDVYNRLPPEKGGPPPGISWYPENLAEGLEVPLLAQRGFLPLVRPPEQWVFSGADLMRVFRQSDEKGYPAVGFEMSASSRVAFGDFTEEHVGERLAIVLNDEIVSAPNINSPLRGSSIIEGRFTDREVTELITVLRSGSLRIKPVLESEEKVGATLGEDYVRRGVLGGLVALGAVLIYMAAYYRRLGLAACVALLCNLLMLVGAMIFLQATLTLPGIAGIVLTVGMAVDANILIFDRIREEGEKGHKAAQAAKEGFKNALSAIVDGNVTTLITALILYNIGSGPVRGFAVTLSVGILTSLFAALVITRVLVHLQLAHGKIERFGMGRWLADARFQFVRHGRIALTISLFFILSGVGLFLSEPDAKKFGIDFLGGASVKVRTEEPVATSEMRALMGGIQGELAQADVAALPSSAAPDGRFREFRITFKAVTDRRSEEPAQGGAQLDFERQVRQRLAGVLQKGPIEADVDPESGKADVVLYFEQEHSVEDVRSALVGTALEKAEVRQSGERPDVFALSGTVPLGTDAGFLRTALLTRFVDARDGAGRDMTLSLPVAESTVIGPQVVGELRDSAIKALLIAIILTVIYIRVRFAEYSYGIAAVAAVVHDVLATLAAVAVMIQLGWVQVEMNLTLIAAFLTIFGYSLNDTIVIFDRVRENLPRVKGTLTEVVDLSVSQTLSRTICTSGTVLMATLTLLIFNFGTGNALEGFGFAMVFGVITGTYSTIYIACPLLVWLEQRSRRKAEREKEGGRSRRPAEPAPTAP